MPKGDDFIRKKKNKQLRKRINNSESAVCARVAGIIASKRRRKNGKRRSCEGMCYSLPTLDDPFNDRHGKKEPNKKKPNKEAPNKKQKRESNSSGKNGKKTESLSNGEERSCPSKFLMVCLNAIKDAWREENDLENTDNPFNVNSWGLDLWRCCSTGTNVLDATGTDCSREQIAWLVSVASDIFARKEKLGVVINSPYLLYIVPTQEKAVQVRSICKPLKAVGIHSVSLHPGASIQHQFHGLKSCEPEFLISTPDRLLELVSLKAINISNVSLLIVDGLGQGDAPETGYADEINSIKEVMSGNPHVIIFGGFCEQMAACAQNLLGKSFTRLTVHDDL